MDIHRTPRSPRPSRPTRPFPTPHERAQFELARLLRHLRSPAEPAGPRMPAAPPVSSPQPTPPSSRQRPAMATAPRARASRLWRFPWPSPETGLRASVVLVATLAAGAFALAAIGFIVLSSDSGRIKAVMGKHSAEIVDLKARQDDLRSEVKTRVDNLQSLVTEVRYPPTLFGEAQDLFRAQRYGDAESAYMRFMMQSPSSRLADIALNNAAAAAAMHGNCDMAAAHARNLKTRFPGSPLNAKLASLQVECRKLRASRGQAGH
jgi:hypothetical protein